MTSVLTDQDRMAWHGPLRKVLQHHGVTRHGDSVLEADILEAVKPLIEAAVIRKLSAGVSVEPYATLHHDDGYFTTKQREHDLRYSGAMRTEVVTLDQLQTAIAAARVQENERCAQFFEPSITSGHAAYAKGIRALLGKEAT